MTIYELSDILGINLIITRYANQDNRHMAQFESVDISKDSMLIGFHGNGKNAQEAIKDYVNKIKGQRIKTERFEHSKYFNVPNDLTA